MTKPVPGTDHRSGPALPHPRPGASIAASGTATVLPVGLRAAVRPALDAALVITRLARTIAVTATGTATTTAIVATLVTAPAALSTGKSLLHLCPLVKADMAFHSERDREKMDVDRDERDTRRENGARDDDRKADSPERHAAAHDDLDVAE